MIWAWLLLCYIIVFYFREYQIRKKSPPGPWPVPILGNLLQLGRASKDPYLAIHEVSKRFNGDVTRLIFGSQETVILSSYEAVKEVLAHPEALGRPLDGLIYYRNDGKRLGLAFTEGEIWEKKRNWTFKHLREFGFSKSNQMESTTNEMVHIFIKEIEEKLLQGVDTLEIKGAFPLPTFRIMWKMLVGRGQMTPEQDKIIIPRLLHRSEKMIEVGAYAGIVTAFPFMRWIIPEWCGYNAFMEFKNDCSNIAKILLEETITKLEKTLQPPKTLTEAYATEIIGGTDHNAFNVEDFAVLFMDLLQTSSDTVSCYLEAITLFLVLNPKAQDKIYKEILDCIVQGEKAAYADLKRMNYTQAFLLEVHRCALIAPVLAPRRAIKDFFYKGFLIKENSTILANMTALCNDTKIFEDDPEMFRPERFIGTDGGLSERAKYLISFGAGKRICPGVPYVEVVSFLLFVNILQKFELSTVPGEAPPTTEMKAGLSSRPWPFQISIKKRETLK